MALRSPPEEMPALNLTSMIDVLFLLIIFFMVGTKFVESERQIDLKLPSSRAGATLSAAPEKKQVSIYQDGQITLDRHTVTLEELTDRLTVAHRQYKGLGVIVRGDRTVDLQRLTNVLEACRQAGITELAIATTDASTANKNNARR